MLSLSLIDKYTFGQFETFSYRSLSHRVVVVPLFVFLQSFAVIIILLAWLAETPPRKSSILGF
jgi:hypothetical protein